MASHFLFRYLVILASFPRCGHFSTDFLTIQGYDEGKTIVSTLEKQVHYDQ